MMSFHLWVLPILIIGATFVLAIPLGLLHGLDLRRPRTAAPDWLRWIEAPPRHRAAELEAVRPRVHAVQPGRRSSWASRSWPCSPICRSTRTARECSRRPRSSTPPISFLTNTNQQHYSGEVHLSYFSQIVLHLLEADPVAGDRPGRPGGHHPRPARRPAHGQLLPRPVARRGLLLRAALPHRGRAAHGRRRADDPGRQRQGRDGRTGAMGTTTTGPPSRRRSPAARSPPSSP